MLYYTQMFDCRRLMYRHVFPKGAIGAEIGVNLGENACALIQETDPKRLHLIDPWFVKWERNYQIASKVLKLHESIIKIHRKMSSQAVKDFPDNYFDWVYVDGNHAYEFVRDDLWSYCKKVKPGGILAGHDFSRLHYNNPYWGGVRRAVHEFLNEGLCELICFSQENQRSFAMKVRKKRVL